MAEKKKTFKLDIFAILSKLERGDLHIWETLTEEEQKSLSIYVTTQWMFGTTSQIQVMMLNEFVNQFVFPFAKHPELLVKLLAICGTKTNKRFTWVPLPKKTKSSDKLSVKVLMENFDWSEREASSNIGLLSDETMIEYSELLGWSKEEITKLKKELKEQQ